MEDRIYLDNAATTSLDPEVLQEMMPWLPEHCGNPSSIHGTGREAQRALDRARKRTAAALGAKPQEIYFTSGGTESDNWALRGAAWAGREKGRHLITDAVEHHAVLHTFRWLEEQGFETTVLPVDSLGRVDPEAVRRAIRKDTILVSVMAANNEIGTLQPVEEIGRITREAGVLFHTDAVQAIGAIPVSPEAWGADLLSLSGHKFHGPKGTGALYIRLGTRIAPLMQGGAQERGLRGGTENVAGIVGLGRAIEKATGNIPERTERIRALRDRLIRGVLEGIPEARLNGDPDRRLPGNAHFSFPGVDGEALLLRLDLMGIACSGGSACTSGSPEPSHVLTAIGQGPELAGSGLRITLGDGNTEAEIDETLAALKRLMPELRGLR